MRREETETVRVEGKRGSGSTKKLWLDTVGQRWRTRIIGKKVKEKKEKKDHY